MPSGSDVVLTELDLGHVTVRAVRTPVRDELRGMLAGAGTAVGDEIVEVRWGDAPSGQPVLSERPTMIIIDDSLALRVCVFWGCAVEGCDRSGWAVGRVLGYSRQASDQSTVATVTGSASPFNSSERSLRTRKALPAVTSASRLAMISPAPAAAAIRAVAFTPRPT